jgi:hypothetical protein
MCRPVDAVYLSLGNAVLLVRAVITKLTRRREEETGDGEIGGGGFEETFLA